MDTPLKNERCLLICIRNLFALFSAVFVSKCKLIGNYFLFILLHVSYAFNILCFGLVTIIKIIIFLKILYVLYY